MPVRSTRLSHLVRLGVSALSLALALALALASSGCWSKRELEKTGFVLGFGIDEITPKAITMTVQTAIPSLLAGGKEGGGGGGGEAGPVWVATASGPTLFDAIRSLNSRSSDTLFWAHARVLVISESVARRGLRPVLDFLSRQPQIRPSVSVVVTPGASKDILSLASPQAKIPVFYLTDLLEHANLQGRTLPVDLQDLQMATVGSGREPTAPIVRPFTEPEPAKKKPPKPPKAAEASKSKEKAEGEEGEGEKKPTELSVTGTAVFRGDRMVGVLTPAETAGLRWVLGGMESTPVTLNFPDSPQHVTVEIIRSSVKILARPDITDPARSRFTVVIKGEGNLQELAAFAGPPRYRTAEEIDRALSREVEQTIRRTIVKAQKKYRSDIFGFGERYRESVPAAVWRRVGSSWSRYFAGAHVNVRVELAVRRRGMTLRP